MELNHLLAIDMGWHTLFGKDAVDLGAVSMAEPSMRRRNVLLQLLIGTVNQQVAVGQLSGKTEQRTC